MKTACVLVVSTVMIMGNAMWVAASAPVGVNYQGRLLESGTPVNGSRTVQFDIYKASSGGSPVYTESESVTCVDGLFSTVVGDADTSTFLSATADGTVWLQVTVGGTPLGSRQRIVPALSALHALTSEGLCTTGGLKAAEMRMATGSWGDAPIVILGISEGSSRNDVDGSDASYGAVIGGGLDNHVGASCPFSTLAGGLGNLIDHDSASTVLCGGRENTISYGANYAAIGGGNYSKIYNGSEYGFIGSGYGNEIRANSASCAIGGGYLNAIGANAQRSTIPGGYKCIVSNDAQYALAAGCRAVAAHVGCFVWADNNDYDFPSTGVNQFQVRCTGGARMVTSINGSGTPTAGVTMSPGAGSWTSLSDREAKTAFLPVDKQALLEKVAGLPMETWQYKSQDASIRHIGPMAQDFREAFGVGEDPKGISTVDADGVALTAIQGLYEVVKQQKAEIARLRERLTTLEQKTP